MHGPIASHDQLMNSSQNELEDDLNQVQIIALLVMVLLIFVVLSLMRWGKFSLSLNTAMVITVALCLTFLIFFYISELQNSRRGMCLISRYSVPRNL